MSYRDYYLRFADEAAMQAVWPWKYEDGVPVAPDNGAADFVGQVGDWYLVNLRMAGELPDAQLPGLSQ